MRDRRPLPPGQESQAATEGAGGLDLRAMARHKRALERRAETNQTGMPDAMKDGLEQLGGVDLSDVRVRRDSQQAKQTTGTSFAGGDEIHLGPGQEANLGHEAWHVVQQRQGRVAPTGQRADGRAVNEDPGLEREADEMGTRAAGPMTERRPMMEKRAAPAPVIQGGWVEVEGTDEKLNLETLAGQQSEKGEQLYRDNKTQKLYVEASSSSNGKVTVREYQPKKTPAKKAGSAGGSESKAAAATAAGDSDEDTSAGASGGDASNGNAGGSSSSSSSGGATNGDGGSNGAHAGVDAVYRGWSTEQTSQVDVDTDYGTVRARHSRGAPYIQSRADEWGDQALGDTYAEYQRGVRDDKASDSTNDVALATDLLAGTDENIESFLQKRAAAMLTTTVGLAEQWRKQGAAKIFRAALRLVKNGEITLDKVLDGTYFQFVGSAEDGQKQVGAIQDLHEGDTKEDDADEINLALYQNMANESPIRDDDLSSDEETRGRKTQKKNRLYAKKHQVDEEEAIADAERDGGATMTAAAGGDEEELAGDSKEGEHDDGDFADDEDDEKADAGNAAAANAGNQARKRKAADQPKEGGEDHKAKRHKRGSRPANARGGSRRGRGKRGR